MHLLRRSLLTAAVAAASLPASVATAQLTVTPEPTAEENIARWSGELDTSVRTAQAPLAATDIRRLARRSSLRVDVALPWPPVMLAMWTGPLRIEWTAPARVVRRLGVNPNGRSRVRLARGVTSGDLSPSMTVELDLTKSGRRALRRAERLKIAVVASLAIDPNSAGMVATQALTLQRRP